MKVHVLLRGQHYVEDDTPFSHKFHKRNFMHIGKNFRHFCYEPLKQTFDVQFYVITWDSPVADVFEKICSKTILLPIENFNQKGFEQFDLVAQGLELIPKNDDSIVLILRLDTIFKKPVTEWFDFTSDFDIVVPYKETGPHYWDRYFMPWKNKASEHRISDIFHFLKNRNGNLDKFSRIVKVNPFDAHEIYDDLITEGFNVKFCVQDYYDSDTSKKMSIAVNPLFFLQRNYHYEIDWIGLKLNDEFGEPLYGF